MGNILQIRLICATPNLEAARARWPRLCAQARDLYAPDGEAKDVTNGLFLPHWAPELPMPGVRELAEILRQLALILPQRLDDRLSRAQLDSLTQNAERLGDPLGGWKTDDAAAALQAALNGLQAYYRDPDLTDGLAAAYPLTENGNDLTDAANAANRVLYMNGTATSALTSGFFVRRQGRTAAKLFTDDMLNRGEMTTDPDAPSSTGLKIPSAAFAGVTADTGMTLTVSVLAESWSAEYQWSRILQLGTKDPNGDGASGAQFFYALQSIYTRANITTPGGLDWIEDNVGIPTLGEWITVSLSFEPNQHTIYLYVSSFSTSQWSGGTAMTEYTVSAAEYETIITAILNGQDNWIGRSYWATDDNLIGYASNLSVYGRALTTDEVTQLHAAKDLSAFVE